MAKRGSKYTIAADVVGRCSAPFKVGAGPIPVDVLRDEVIAAASGTSISIIQVDSLEVVAVLANVHDGPITAVSWSPDCGTRDLKVKGHLKLASADEGGEVVVWNVSLAQPIARCLLSNAPGGQKTRGSTALGPIISLAWILPSPSIIAALISPADLVLWNGTGDAIMHYDSLSATEVLTAMTVDPWNSSHLAISSLSGSLLLVRVIDGAKGQLDVTRHAIELSGTGTFDIEWTVMRGVLLLIFSDRLTLFDVDYSRSLTSVALPDHLPPFVKCLDVRGTGTSLGTGDDGGLSILTLQHEDGSVSVWQSQTVELDYKLVSFNSLKPSFQAKSLGSAPHVLGMIPIQKHFPSCADHHIPPPSEPGSPATTRPSEVPDRSAGNLASLGSSSLLDVFSAFLGSAASLSTPDPDPVKSLIDLDIPVDPSSDAGAKGDDEARAARVASQRSTLDIVSLMSQGQIWRWELTLPSPVITDKEEPLPPPKLQQMFQSVPSPMSCMSVFPHLVSSSHVPGLHRFAQTSVSSETAAPTPRRSPPPQHPVTPQGAQPKSPSKAPPFNSHLHLTGFKSMTPSPRANKQQGTPPTNGPPSSTLKHEEPSEGNDVRTLEELFHEEGEGGAERGDSGRKTKSDSADTACTKETCLSLIAAGTKSGSVEILAVTRGLLQPFAFAPILSFKVSKHKVQSVHWMGTTLRVAVLVSTPNTPTKAEPTPRHSNSIAIIDLVSRTIDAFYSSTDDKDPLIVIRPSPSGRYMFTRPRQGGTQIWCTPIGLAPILLRNLELPMLSLNWVMPTASAPQMWSHDMEQDARAPYYKPGATALGGTPRKSDNSFMHSDSQRNAQPASAITSLAESSTPRNAPDGSETPQALFIVEGAMFALVDGRLGSLNVSDRGVTKRLVRPMKALIDELVTTAITAVGSVAFVGDVEGRMYEWDTSTGNATMVSSGRRAIRKMQAAPPAAEHLYPDPMKEATQGRLAVLFNDGAFGVWEMSSALKLHVGTVSVTATAYVGQVLDLAWLPLPAPLGGGSIAVLLTADGELAAMDLAQPIDMRPRATERFAALQYLSASPAHAHHLANLEPLSPRVPHLASPNPSTTLLLMKRHHSLLLCALIQAGVSPPDLLAIVRASEYEATELAHSVLCRLLGINMAKVPSTDPDAGLTDLLGDVSVLSMGPSLESVKAKSDWDPFGPATTRTNTSCGPSATPDRNNMPLHSIRPASATDELLRSLKPASMVNMLKEVARVRSGCTGFVLSPDEETAYAAALSLGDTPRGLCARMSVAASMMGSQLESRFWRHLPDTLAALKCVFEQEHNAGTPKSEPVATSTRAASRPNTNGSLQSARSNASDGASRPPLIPTRGTPPPRDDEDLWEGTGTAPEGLKHNVLLFSERMLLLEARQRVEWHERMPKATSSDTQDRTDTQRVLEYVAIGDLETAVGMLMACKPANSIAYYRNSLMTVALASASGTPVQSTSYLDAEVRQTWSSRRLQRQAATPFQLQATKVVAIQASSIGDSVIGVPLLCSVGFYDEAAALLQVAGSWRLAAVLAARTLSGKARTLVLQAWAQHVLRKEGGNGGIWRATGLLIAAGCLHTALKVLKSEGLPDSAHAFVQACHGFGLVAAVSSQPPDAPVRTPRDSSTNQPNSDSAVTTPGTRGPARRAVSFTASGQLKEKPNSQDLNLPAMDMFNLEDTPAPSPSESRQSAAVQHADSSRDMLLLPNLFSDVQVPNLSAGRMEGVALANGLKKGSASGPSLGVVGVSGEAIVDGDGFEMVEHADDVRLVLKDYNNYVQDLVAWTSH